MTALADTVGAGVHYNTLIPWRHQPNPANFGSFKYGVISVNRLREDLSHWTDMFVAGRMQKPVALVGAADPRVAAAAADNIRAALAAALLLLPETFSASQLHETLCGLSYHGDIRLALLAEDVEKIKRIAAGSRAGLARLYGDAMKELGRGAVGLQKADAPSGGCTVQADSRQKRHGEMTGAVAGRTTRAARAVRADATRCEREDDEEQAEGDGSCGAEWWGQDKGVGARIQLLKHLPGTVLDSMRQRAGVSLPGSSWGAGARREELAEALAKRVGSHEAELRDVLRRIVRRSSVRQLLSTALTTSPEKAVQYVASKLMKSVLSRVR